MSDISLLPTKKLTVLSGIRITSINFNKEGRCQLNDAEGCFKNRKWRFHYIGLQGFMVKFTSKLVFWVFVIVDYDSFLVFTYSIWRIQYGEL